MPTSAKSSIALDAGALVVVVPTIDSKAEAIEARNWTYFPPLGRRSNGGGQAFELRECGAAFPAAYRSTINDNIVLIEMIETLEGLKEADEIAKVPASPPYLPPAATSATFQVPARDARLRARHQHRARCGHQGRQAAVRSDRVARSRRLHVLSGGERARRHRARRRRGARAAGEHLRRSPKWVRSRGNSYLICCS
jgi:hypothetical protein